MKTPYAHFYFQVFSPLIFGYSGITENNMFENVSGDKIKLWIDSFQHNVNETKADPDTKSKSTFRYSYLTYLKLLRELNSKTSLSEKVGGVEETEILYPSSHSLTQTDREYFNIVRTEDGQSMFARQQDRKREDKVLKERGGEKRNK